MGLPQVLVDALKKELSTSVLSFQAISGGDINRAYRLETLSRTFFLKFNEYSQGGEMLRTEKRGLDLLAASGSIAIPSPIALGTVQSYHFLLLEDWRNTRPITNFWENFGQQLASLHQHTAPHFGLDHDNFIATLPQSNQPHDHWPSFYWQERLYPLLRKAVDQQLVNQQEALDFERLEKKIDQLFPTATPALLHGDLWSGNYMVAPSGQAGLIDPSVYYGHREMDLAMTKLFGGFSSTFYDAYTESFPLDPHWKDRIPICQLYPLLVHVLLFGRTYWSSIKTVLSAYR